MTDPARSSPETILRQCATAAPHPWYPADYVRANGVTRDELDPNLDRLRLAGLIHLTEWVAGKGQGYALTEAGTKLLQSPRDLERLRNVNLEAPGVVVAPPRDPTDWRRTAWERGEDVRNALYSPAPPYVTYALFLVNVLVFLGGVGLAIQRRVPLHDYLNRNNDAQVRVILHDIGALQGADIIQGEWWRLLSCCFVHIGFMHLLLNMIGLFTLGRMEESMWGPWRYLILYIFSALAGSCGMLVNNPLILGAGASGGIWGIMMGLITWIFLNRAIIGSQAKPILAQLMGLLILNVFISTLPGISAAAHFAGGAAGLVVALLLQWQRYGSPLGRVLAILGLLAVPVLSLGSVVWKERTDPRWQRLEWEVVLEPQVIDLWHEVEHLEKDELDPQLGRLSKAVDEQARIAALVAIDQMRQKLDQGVQLLQNVGPLPDDTRQRLRDEELDRFSHALKQLRKIEWHQVYLSQVGILWRESERLNQSESVSLKGKDFGRTDASYANALATMRQALQWLEASTLLLQKAGPYQEESLERERQQYLKESLKHLEMFAFKEHYEFLLPYVERRLGVVLAVALAESPPGMGLLEKQRAMTTAVGENSPAATFYDEQRGTLADAMNEVRKSGPYRTASIEASRQKLLKAGDDLDRLLQEESRRERRARTWTEKEEAELSRLKQEFRRSFLTPKAPK